MWTLKLPPAARSVGPQDSDWLGLVPALEHTPFSYSTLFRSDQVTPAPEPAGSASLTVTPLAVPVPELLTVMVKPMASPALTVLASATLVMWMSPELQVMTSLSSSEPSLVVVTNAVLS